MAEEIQLNNALGQCIARSTGIYPTIFHRLSIVVVLWTVAFTSIAASSPAAEEVLKLLGVQSDQVDELDRGEIIVQPVSEATEKELALDVALYLHAPLPAVVSYLKRGSLDAIDPDIIAQGEIPPGAGVEAFKRFTLTARQGDEVEDLLNAEPGDRFNLSVEEIASFKPLKEKLAEADKNIQAQEVSQHYREILWRRFQAYRKSGLAGIATYAHEDGIAPADPADELRAAAKNDMVLARFYPKLLQALLNYPSDMPEGAEEQFFWHNRRVEGRPTAILGHRILRTNDSGAVIAIRQYYVGHSFNSLTLLVGCLPYRDGTIVFYAQRTSTDQVAGAASELRHAIGREQMKAHMVSRLEALRKALKSVSR